MEKFKNNRKGITLIALIITIIVLLILAGMSIRALTVDNSILKKAANSKESIEIEEEKELIALSVVHSMKKNKLGNIDEEGLQNGLDMNFGEDGAIAIKDGDNYLVVVEESGRIHNVSGDGKVEPEGKIEIDPKAGDITKGGVSKGTSALPYEISCIEDLVAFSKAIGNNEISRSCYAIVTKDLDFKSIFSYGDYKKTYSYDSGKNAYVEDENSTTRLMELCTTGQGFIPIDHFSGMFDGKKNTIRNMYIEKTGNAGLFGVRDANKTNTISNITITGEITSTDGSAAGILATNSNHNLSIINCHNEAKITAYTNAGGIIGNGGGFWVAMQECSNTADIKARSQLAGLIGIGSGSLKNCYNTGSVTLSGYYNTTNAAIGGLVGKSQSTITMTNCYNTGPVKGIHNYANVGGMVGLVYGTVTANNSYNIGNITKSGIHRGSSTFGASSANNCYNLGELIGDSGYEFGASTVVDRSYYSSTVSNGNARPIEGLIDISDKSLSEFVELLNSYRKETTDGEGNTVQVWPSGWKTWKAGENGYPVFDE